MINSWEVPAATVTIEKDNMATRQTDNIPASPAKFSEVNISVLGFQEGNEWAAIALEMDLRGYGATFEAALAELEELVEMQISFSHFKQDPDLVFHPAEPAYWRLYAQVNQERLRALSNAIEDPDPEYHTGVLSLPPAHVIAGLGKDFHPTRT